MPVVRYDVIIIGNGRPQPRKSFQAVDAAAAFIAKKHMTGHIVKCLGNADTETLREQRQTGMAKRVNAILAKKGFRGEPWKP
jgi:hypothetical protein